MNSGEERGEPRGSETPARRHASNVHRVLASAGGGGGQGGDRPCCTVFWVDGRLRSFHSMHLPCKQRIGARVRSTGTKDYLLMWCVYYGGLLFAKGHARYSNYPTKSRWGLHPIHPRGREMMPRQACTDASQSQPAVSRPRLAHGRWGGEGSARAARAARARWHDVSQSRPAPSRCSSRLCRGSAHGVHTCSQPLLAQPFSEPQEVTKFPGHALHLLANCCMLWPSCAPHWAASGHASSACHEGANPNTHAGNQLAASLVTLYPVQNSPSLYKSKSNLI